MSQAKAPMLSNDRDELGYRKSTENFEVAGTLDKPDPGLLYTMVARSTIGSCCTELLGRADSFSDTSIRIPSSQGRDLVRHAVVLAKAGRALKKRRSPSTSLGTLTDSTTAQGHPEPVERMSLSNGQACAPATEEIGCFTRE